MNRPFSLPFLPGILSAALLTGCAALEQEQGQRWPSPLVPVKQEYALSEVRVKWIRVPLPRLAAFSADYTETAGLQGSLIAGMAIPPVDEQDGRCVVLVPEIHANDDLAMRALGHEVAHCFLGRWHDSWDGALEAKRMQTAVPGPEMREKILLVMERYFPEYLPEILKFLNGESAS